jgi:hypothetical protein
MQQVYPRLADFGEEPILGRHEANNGGALDAHPWCDFKNKCMGMPFLQRTCVQYQLVSLCILNSIDTAEYNLYDAYTHLGMQPTISTRQLRMSWLIISWMSGMGVHLSSHPSFHAYRIKL